MKTLLILLLATVAQTQAEQRAKTDHAKGKPAKLITTRSEQAVTGAGICPCPESKPLKAEDAQKSLSYFKENKPYNSFDLSKDMSSAQATSHFSELPGQKGRGIVALNTPSELNACLEEGDVLVYFRTSNDVPSANNLQGHIQEGTSHAAVVMKDKDGKFYHIDSPQGYGGPYSFSGPFHVMKLRKNKLYGDKKPEEVLKRVKELALKMQGTVQYDSSLTTDVYVEGKKLAGAKAKLPEIMKRGCEAVCSKIEGGKCPPMYCSELVYTLYALAGVEDLEAEGLSALVKRLEEDVFKGLPEGEKGLMRQRFVDTMFNDQALRAVMPEAQRNSARTLVETLMNPNTPQFVRDTVDATRGPIFFPHSFIREARKDEGAFCYAGSYLGGAFGSGGGAVGQAQQPVPPSANLYLTLQGHYTDVLSAQFSPDGHSLVTASENTTKIWDAQTGQPKAVLQRFQTWVQSAEFSPDGKSLVTASSDKTAQLWDVQTGQLKKTLQGHSSSVRSAQFSPDGKFIVTASDDNTAKLWDVQTGQLKATLQGHSATVLSAQFSPDGKFIVTASRDNTAKLWDAQSGQLKATLQGHSETVRSPQFSPDGKFIVTASDDDTAKLWDVQTGQLKATLQGHSANVLSAQFSPDGKTIVTASHDKTAKLWDVQTRQLKATLQGHSGSVYTAKFSPDGKFIVTASRDRTAMLWVAGASVSERATDFMSRLYAAGPENTDAALAALTDPNNQTEWKNLVTAMKNHAGLTKEAVHTLVNNQVSAVPMQNALKTIADTFY